MFVFFNVIKSVSILSCISLLENLCLNSSKSFLNSPNFLLLILLSSFGFDSGFVFGVCFGFASGFGFVSDFGSLSAFIKSSLDLLT